MGRACYRYSDQESLIIARDVALSLAKREALEGYVVFVEASSAAENFALKNDLILSLTTGYLKNLRVVEQSEDPAKREVCRKIAAEVEPGEIRKQIDARLVAARREFAAAPTGIAESKYFRAVAASKGVCGSGILDEYSVPIDMKTMLPEALPPEGKKNCIDLTAVCKREWYPRKGDPASPRITWVDSRGTPYQSFRSRLHGAVCISPGDIVRFWLPLPVYDADESRYLVDFPE
jgi:hypothetical protein